MTSRFSNLSYVGLIGAVLWMSAPSRAEPGRPTVLAMLQNLAGAPSDVVEPAQAEVSRLYAVIGVEVVWVTEVPDHAQQIRVVCLSAMGPPRGVTVADSALGYTLLPLGKRAILTYVFWRRVESASQKFTTAIDKLLAIAIAHELGHMLLPDARHAKTGLMRAMWDGNDFRAAGEGLLVFSPDSAALILREVERERGSLRKQPVPHGEDQAGRARGNAHWAGV